MTNNWRTIRKARREPDGKPHWAYGLIWIIFGLVVGWALGRSF